MSSITDVNSFVAFCQGSGTLLVQQDYEIIRLFNSICVGSDCSYENFSTLKWQPIPASLTNDLWRRHSLQNGNSIACWNANSKVLELNYNDAGNGDLQARLLEEGKPPVEIPTNRIYIQKEKIHQNLTPHLYVEQGMQHLYLFDSNSNQSILVVEKGSHHWNTRDNEIDRAITALCHLLKENHQERLASPEFSIRLRQCQDAVCLIKTPTQTGTGFIIANRLLITNQHVLPDKQSIRGFEVEFFYDTPLGSGKISVKLDPDRFYMSSNSPDGELTGDCLDFAIVALEDDPRLKDVFAHPIPLDMTQFAVSSGRINTIHHPGGHEKQVSLVQDSRNRILRIEKYSFIHTAATDEGSSGAPILSASLQLIGLHRKRVGENEVEKSAIKADKIRYYLQTRKDPDRPGMTYWGRINVDFIPATVSAAVLNKIKMSLPTALPYFRGRENTLKDMQIACRFDAMHAALPTAVLHLYGPSGTGKSETAIFFANQHLGDLSRVWYIRCEDQDAYKRDYLLLAKALGLHTEGVPLTNVIENVHLELSNSDYQEPWLIIFDNIEKSIPIPERGGIAIRTSVHENVGTEAATKIYVDVFDVPDTDKVLSALISDSQRDRSPEELVKELEGSPLLITQAALYIKDKPDIKLSDYIKELRSIDPVFIKGKTRYPSSMGQAFTLTLKHLQNNPEALKLLFCSLFLMPDGIDVGLFAAWSKEGRLRWREEAVSPLIDLCVFRITDKPTVLRYHRLWQLFLRTALDTDKSSALFEFSASLKNAYEKILLLFLDEFKKFSEDNSESFGYVNIAYFHACRIIADPIFETLKPELQLDFLMYFKRIAFWNEDPEYVKLCCQKGLSLCSTIYPNADNPIIASFKIDQALIIGSRDSNSQQLAMEILTQAITTLDRCFSDEVFYDLSRAFLHKMSYFYLKDDYKQMDSMFEQAIGYFGRTSSPRQNVRYLFPLLLAKADAHKTEALYTWILDISSLDNTQNNDNASEIYKRACDELTLFIDTLNGHYKSQPIEMLYKGLRSRSSFYDLWSAMETSNRKLNRVSDQSQDPLDLRKNATQDFVEAINVAEKVYPANSRKMGEAYLEYGEYLLKCGSKEGFQSVEKGVEIIVNGLPKGSRERDEILSRIQQGEEMLKAIISKSEGS